MLVLLVVLLCGCASVAPMPRVLVFTRTEGWRHDSIPDAVAALRRLGAREGIAVESTEDAGAFTADNLARYQSVVFASTTLDVLDGAQQAALQAFVRGGGGFMGVHAAADTEYDWPWYGQLVGARFDSHPEGLQSTTVRFEMDGLLEAGAGWRVTDEIYNYRSNPRPRVQVIATVDERDYTGGTMGADHPIAWCHAFDGGRSWYTGLGHTSQMFDEPVFLRHLARGLRYAVGLSPGC